MQREDNGLGELNHSSGDERRVPRFDLAVELPGATHTVPDQNQTTGFVTPWPKQRRYLPTLADLVDRLAIVQLKAVFIPEHREEYMQERADIEHDIDLIIREKGIKFDAAALHAVLVVMLANRFIWENESKARAGGPDQDRLLKLTHSINGVRNTAKNQLARVDSGRMDYKIDCFSAELIAEFGNWSIFA
jgi:hypothetical protein